MTRIPWPAGVTSRRTRELTVDKLPRSVLHSLVSDIPGPKNETDADRVARFDAQLAQVLGYRPRSTAEAMLAVRCVMFRALAKETIRAAATPGRPPTTPAKVLRNEQQFTRMIRKWETTLTRRQAEPEPLMDPAIYKSLGLNELLVLAPAAVDHDEEAVSAIIVPLHPAPKMLQ